MRLPSKLHLPTLLAACFAMIWFVFRAQLQSITMDEAGNYLGWVAPSWASHWYPDIGNHVLYTILTRLLTWMFGLSHLTVRGPVLLGAAIYISAVYQLCVLIGKEERLIWPLFVCFVYNPFVMDYMVAARGYSLALGFLMVAFLILARQLLRYRPGEERTLIRTCGFASASAGLSFCANFSFAYVNAACLLLFSIWACREMFSAKNQQQDRLWRLKKCVRLAAACLLPGLLVVLLVSGGVLWNWRAGQTYLGAHSYSETWRGLLVSSFYELNPVVVNPLLYSLLGAIQPYLPRLGIALAVSQFALIAIRKSGPAESPRRRLFPIAVFASAMIAVTIFLHWCQLKLFGLPLPKERTALFFVPLSLIVFGIVTAIGPPSATGRMLRRASIVVLFITAGYFIGCLRLMYFREYKFGADVKAAFPMIQEVSRRYGAREIPTSTDYSAALNFYRLYFRDTTIQPFQDSDPTAPGKLAYVLPYDSAREFIRKEGLKIIYRGELTDLVILIRAD